MPIIPRLVGVAEAARYCGLTPPGFRAAVKRGIFPRPYPGTRQYDLDALKHRMDIVSGIVDETEKKPQLNALDSWLVSSGYGQSDL